MVKMVVHWTMSINPIKSQFSSFQVLHMDLKPQNVLVDVNGNLRLADFGLSQKMEDDQNTFYQVGSVI